MHYQRWRATGDPLGAVQRPLGRLVDSELTYAAVHQRIHKVRGRASDLPCAGAGCQSAAQDWCYDYLDPEERVDAVTGLAFSTDLAHYVPLCRRCHRRADKKMSVHQVVLEVFDFLEGCEVDLPVAPWQVVSRIVGRRFASVVFAVE